jgi:tetratricopeptide (TPR) repeat protein
VTGRGAAAALLGLAGACVAPPADPFEAAQRARSRGDLAMALQALDAVPVAHASYPEARAQALDVEADLRRSQELLLQAMRLRMEWRDAEALQAIEQAQAIWPELPGAAALAAATRHRLQMLAASGGTASPAPGPTVVAAPALPEPGEEEPAAPAAETRAAPAAQAAGRGANDQVAAALVTIETRLGSGQFERAVHDLLALARQHPGDLRVRSRLVRVLHQRALMRYGEGQVEAAIADWQQVLELEQNHAAARFHLRQAEREIR